MLRSGTRQEAMARGVRHVDNGPFHGSAAYLIVSPPGQGRAPSPQAYQVQQEPDWIFQTHFHLTAQFQVVVGGSGRLGSHDLAPVTVHYAAPQSGYGPLVAGPNGLTYLTIRAQTDSGMWCLPEQKDRMEHPMRRFHGWSERIEPSDAGALPHAIADSRVAIPVQPDGSMASVETLPAHGRAARPATGRRGEEFYLVLGGTLAFDGRWLAAGEIGYASADHPAPTMEAGDGGVQFLVLSFGVEALVDVPVTPSGPPVGRSPCGVNTCSCASDGLDCCCSWPPAAAWPLPRPRRPSLSAPCG